MSKEITMESFEDYYSFDNMTLEDYFNMGNPPINSMTFEKLKSLHKWYLEGYNFFHKRDDFILCNERLIILNREKIIDGILNG